MPNLTTPIPPALTGNQEEDLKRLKRWGTALVDELTYLFGHLDAGNVLEAASVKAENIDTNSAKIENAQIGALTADKLIAGTVDTEKVTVADGNGKLEISGSEIIIRDRNYPRFMAAYDRTTGKFRFVLCNEDGVPTVSINSSGDAIFSGQVESSSIFSSTIVGTDSESYQQIQGDVFAQLDPTGIKVMQDKDGVRRQKIGMSVSSNDGTAYLVLGAGNGEGSKEINGVVYTNGAFKIEKNEAYANMGLVGYQPFICFWENGNLELAGGRVLLNGIDVAERLYQLEEEMKSLKGN